MVSAWVRMSCQLTPAPAVPRGFRTDVMVCLADGVRVANQDIIPSMMSKGVHSAIPANLEPPGQVFLGGTEVVMKQPPGRSGSLPTLTR